MVRAVVLAVLLAGCGRIGFTELSDAPRTDGPISVAPCGATTLVADRFDTATAGPQWAPFADPGVAIGQGGNNLVIALPATTPIAGNSGGYNSSWSYDARGSRLFVEVPQTVSPATNAQTSMRMRGLNGDYVKIAEENGMLYALRRTSGVVSTVGMVAYDPVAARWWQLREDAGTLSFEMSPDGSTFTPFASLPTPAFAQLVEVILESLTYQSETNAGQSQFANLNGGAPVGQYCAASSLRDDFNAGALDDQWGASYEIGGCSFAKTGGGIDITLTSSGAQDCAIVSKSGFDLTGEAVFTAITTAPNGGETFSYLRASTVAGDNVEVAQTGTQLVCAMNVAGTFMTSCAVPFDPVAHKFWQLVESGGNLSWQVSPDGATWTTLQTQPSPISLAAVNLSIGAGTNVAVATPGSATFSTFGQLPP